MAVGISHSAFCFLTPALPLLWSLILPVQNPAPAPLDLNPALQSLHLWASPFDYQSLPSEGVLCTQSLPLETEAELAESGEGKHSLEQFLQRQNLFRPCDIYERW